MPFRLIAMDLDGTLLDEELHMSARVRQALDACAARGIRLTLASGRSFRSMRSWARSLHIITPLICYQGAVIVDPVTEQVLYERTFPVGPLLAELRDFGLRYDISLTVYVDDQIYVTDKRQSDAFYDKWFGLPYRIVKDVATELPRDPNKVIFIASSEELDAAQPALERQFAGRLQVVRSHPLFLEAMGLGASKGAALAWLAGNLGIAQAEVMAIGDSGNDVSMIDWAGLGVAMGNATEEAKRVAQYVAPSVNEDGVAVALELWA
jgi:Cof subfamily protein (haloacid dehalogenase superfamily)